jgi:hypothetical protein
MKIVDQGIVFDARTAPRDRAFCSFTDCCLTADGRMLVSFRSGSSKDSPNENILMRLSDGGGRTWTTVFEGLGLAVDGKPGAWRSGSVVEVAPGHLLGSFCWFERLRPDMPLSHPDTQGTLPSRMFLMDSTDGGHTWTDRRQVDVAPHEGVAATGAPLRLADGALGVPYEAWKTYYDRSPGEHHAVLRITHDGGRSYDPPVIVAHDAAANLFYWDERLAVDPATGGMVGLFWTHDRQAQQDRNIHIAWGMPDGGQWSAPVDTGIAGQIASPLPLPGGRLLAAYVHRHAPPGLWAVLSEDGGHTWDFAGELCFYDSGAGAESGMQGKREFGDYWADMNVWSFGHPSARLAPDGTAIVVFYGGNSYAMGVHWARIAF